MEIKGRECTAVKIGKFSYYFVDEYLGEERMNFEAIMYASRAIKEGSEIDISMIMDRRENLLKVFCKKIEDEKGEDVEITASHIAGLNNVDYTKLDEVLSGHIEALSNGEKKAPSKLKKR